MNNEILLYITFMVKIHIVIKFFTFTLLFSATHNVQDWYALQSIIVKYNLRKLKITNEYITYVGTHITCINKWTQIANSTMVWGAGLAPRLSTIRLRVCGLTNFKSYTIIRVCYFIFETSKINWYYHTSQWRRV